KGDGRPETLTGDPHRLALLPDLARDPDAALEGQLFGRSLQLGDVDRFQMPDLLAPQHLSVLVQAPVLAYLPSHALAERLEDFRHRIFGWPGLGQNPRDIVLPFEVLLPLPVLGVAQRSGLLVRFGGL